MMNKPGWPRICSSAAIEEGCAIGAQLNGIDYILVRKNAVLHVYHNACPHLGVKLEWQENQFLDHDGELIQCATHGALFLIESGDCIYGPCQGQSLHRVPCKEINGEVLIPEALY